MMFTFSRSRARSGKSGSFQSDFLFLVSAARTYVTARFSRYERNYSFATRAKFRLRVPGLKMGDKW